jgi:hypothetical protein
VSPVKYELAFYIPEGDILHSDRCENLKSYIATMKVADATILHYVVRTRGNRVLKEPAAFYICKTEVVGSLKLQIPIHQTVRCDTIKCQICL